LHNDIEEILVTEEQIQRRVQELGAQITADYSGQDLVLLAVLRGAIVFLADLARNIDLPTTVDFLVVEKIRKEDGDAEVKIIKDLDASVSGRHVLIVEDVIDEGRTLQYLVSALQIREPASLKICTIFAKPQPRLKADYVGFEIADRFVVGYGLDYRQRYRNLSCLGVLKTEVHAPAN
jgi:hypoxanthine phosphoribosyltransferase